MAKRKKGRFMVIMKEDMQWEDVRGGDGATPRGSSWKKKKRQNRPHTVY